MIGCLWKSLREILLLLLLLLKNNININTQQFNKKKDVGNKRERILTSRKQAFGMIQ